MIIGKSISETYEIGKCPDHLLELQDQIIHYTIKNGACLGKYKVSGKQQIAICLKENNNLKWMVSDLKTYNLIKKVGHRELNKIMNAYLTDTTKNDL